MKINAKHNKYYISHKRKNNTNNCELKIKDEK